MALNHLFSDRELADVNRDGKLDFSEFSIACKLINLKLRGFEIPKALPPGLKASAGPVPGGLNYIVTVSRMTKWVVH